METSCLGDEALGHLFFEELDDAPLVHGYVVDRGEHGCHCNPQKVCVRARAQSSCDVGGDDPCEPDVPRQLHEDMLFRRVLDERINELVQDATCYQAKEEGKKLVTFPRKDGTPHECENNDAPENDFAKEALRNFFRHNSRSIHDFFSPYASPMRAVIYAHYTPKSHSCQSKKSLFQNDFWRHEI